MKENTEFRYRIIYEALSLFSGKLSKCNSFESIAECLFTNMKYILDFQLLRLTFYHNGGTINYTLSNRQCSFENAQTLNLWEQEKLFFSEKTPVLTAAENALINDLCKHNILLKDQPKDVWGWNFQIKDNCGMLVTLATNDEKKFSKSDVPVLRLIVENISSKFLSLILIHELDVKKNELENALSSLKDTNEVISKIVREQDDLIEKRTSEIKEKNRRLLQISKHNAHNVREPLARVLGILTIIEQDNSKNILDECMPMLRRSSDDLNKAVNATIHFVDDQITKMKSYEVKGNVS